MFSTSLLATKGSRGEYLILSLKILNNGDDMEDIYLYMQKDYDFKICKLRFEEFESDGFENCSVTRIFHKYF